MPDALLTPQHVTNLLILAFFANEAVRWRGAHSPGVAGDSATMIFRSCYAIAVLALNSPIPLPVMAAPQIVWMGIFATACGLGALVEATVSMKREARAAEDGWRHADRRGNLAFWIGATTASGNVIAALTVAVMMLAATGVHASGTVKGRSVGNPRLVNR
jgi:hypothetical protein